MADIVSLLFVIVLAFCITEISTKKLPAVYSITMAYQANSQGKYPYIATKDIAGALKSCLDIQHVVGGKKDYSMLISMLAVKDVAPGDCFWLIESDIDIAFIGLNKKSDHNTDRNKKNNILIELCSEIAAEDLDKVELSTLKALNINLQLKGQGNVYLSEQCKLITRKSMVSIFGMNM